MKKNLSILAAWFFIALGLSQLVSCRGDDFLQEPPVPAKPEQAIAHDTTHSIVELSGSNDVDLLWIVDNSPSMGSYQQSIANNMKAFMDVFVGKRIHWKMGLISTDVSDAPYLGFDSTVAFDWKSPNAVQTFSSGIGALGINGSGTEMMYAPVEKALTNHQNFLRPNVPLFMIMVSDAPEQSNITTDEFLQFIKTQKGNLNHVVTYGVLGAVEFCPNYTDDYWEYNAPSKYKMLIDGTQGKVWNLCSDFGLNMTGIAQDLVQRIVRPKVYLDDRPVTSTLKVLYHDQELKGGQKADGGYWLYDYDLNAVVFWDLDFAPGDNESVRVVYDAE